MGLVEISGLLLLLLVALLAGGVWIAIALMACGYVGMQFVGGRNLRGPGPRDHDLGQCRVLDARGPAALHLDGRDPLPNPAF